MYPDARLLAHSRTPHSSALFELVLSIVLRSSPWLLASRSIGSIVNIISIITSTTLILTTPFGKHVAAARGSVQERPLRCSATFFYKATPDCCYRHRYLTMLLTGDAIAQPAILVTPCHHYSAMPLPRDTATPTPPPCHRHPTTLPSDAATRQYHYAQHPSPPQPLPH